MKGSKWLRTAKGNACEQKRQEKKEVIIRLLILEGVWLWCAHVVIL